MPIGRTYNEIYNNIGLDYFTPRDFVETTTSNIVFFQEYINKNKDIIPFYHNRFIDIRNVSIISKDENGMYYFMEKQLLIDNPDVGNIRKGFLHLKPNGYSISFDRVRIEAKEFLDYLDKFVFLSEAGTYKENIDGYTVFISSDFQKIQVGEIRYLDYSTRFYFTQSPFIDSSLFERLLYVCNSFVDRVHAVNSGVIIGRSPRVQSRLFRDKNAGEYVTHKIPFAIEIESYGVNEKTVAKMSLDLFNEWGLCRDGSLTSSIGYPVEIQSPILSGKKGEQNVKDVCTLLNNLGFVVDKTCGLHVHFSGDGSIVPKDDKQTVPNLISLYAFHRLFEDVVVSFLPTTRRNNRYCARYEKGLEYEGEVLHFQDIKKEIEHLEKIKNKTDFELFYYKKDDIKKVRYAQTRRYVIHRYWGINFHSLLKSGHIEIRYHSGTLNYEKILHWVELHGKIIERCVAGIINLKYIKGLLDKKLSLEEKTKELFRVLDLKEETVEYFMERQFHFREAETKEVDEIIISKTKKLEII